MKLTQDGEVLAENKVLILYILNKLTNPITNDNLLRLKNILFVLNKIIVVMVIVEKLCIKLQNLERLL